MAQADHNSKLLIVGGGASGVLTAISLIQLGFNPSNITIAEPRELLGEGLAYQTRDPLHRLNVPTGRLSALEKEADDFVKWTGAEPYSFMERRIYSTYLRERLGDEINQVKDSIVNLEPQDSGEVMATLSLGGKELFGAVVLATGLGEARLPDFLTGAPDSAVIIKEVWGGQQWPQCETLLCFGTGLTFIDIALSHLARNPRNKVIAISGSGNLPERHTRSQIAPFTPSLEEVNTLAKLRSYFASAGEHWREAVDGLRPIMEQMWRSFTVEERDEFLRTDGSVWFRRRHRIAPEVGDLVDAEIAAGRLTVFGGKVTSLSTSDSEVKLFLADGRVIEGDYLAICIGRAYEVTDALSLNLLASNQVVRGPLNMGLAVDVSTGQLLKPDGELHANIYALGPLRSGEAFESTAIPEIRRQAHQIAQGITFQVIVKN